MENAIFSCLSSYSCTNNGCNEALIDTGSQISSNLIAHDNSFCLNGDSSNDYSMFGLHHALNYQTPNSIIFSEQYFKDSCQGENDLNYMPEQEDIFSSNNEFQLIRNSRKRAINDASDAIQKPNSITCGLINSASNEGTEEKRRPKQPKIVKEKVPMVRRSQKLTDKITALQKLVSPYGKTDTASVLLEASISIQALHNQTKELFHMISGQQTTNMIGEEGSDLERKGLCLVPCVVLKELDRRSSLHCLLQ